jgi:hypothetical protein
MLEAMQQVNFSPGKALCRFCGEHVSTNRLTDHITREHPRPAARSMAPSLVPKSVSAGKRRLP